MCSRSDNKNPPQAASRTDDVKEQLDDSESSPWPEDHNLSASPTSCGCILQSISSMYNKLMYSYMSQIFKKGAAQRIDKSKDAQLTQHDLYRTPKNIDAAHLNSEFWSIYEQTEQHFKRTLWIVVRKTFIPAGVYQLFALTAQISIPMCVMKLLQALESGRSGDRNNIVYVIAIFLLAIINGVCTQRYQFLSYQSGILLRTALTCAIYEKSLNLSPKGRMGLTNGSITNLVATDTQKLFEVMHEAHQIWSCPIAIVVVVVLMLIIIGPSCLVGAAFLVGLLPLSKKVTHAMVHIRKKRVAVADERIEIVSSMLQDIKITKLNNYEDRFEARVLEARRREMAFIRKEQILWGFTLIIVVSTPVIASFATYATFVLVSSENIMTASVVFTLAQLFNMIKFPINQAGQLLGKLALGLQAMHRISNFMSRESAQNVISEDNPNDNETVLSVQNGEFYVGEQTAEVTSTDGVQSGGFTLSGIDFSLKRGEVLAVLGPVACGKSTLIQSLLQQCASSDKTSIMMASDAKLSYAAQTPFILSTTVRENVLFGLPFEKDRYEKVLDACCLRPDLLLWPAGDLTEIGERGVTMSGGQKARVSVARAVYANADVVLFDDILSALDAGTSQRLFDNVFDNNVHNKDRLLQNSGTILVTHAEHVLKRVDKILVLDRGQSIFCGTWAQLQSFQSENTRHRATLLSMRSSAQLSASSDTTNSSEKIDATKNVKQVSVIAKDTDASKGELKSDEQREHGGSSVGVWLLWFVYAGGFFFIIMQVIFLILDRGSYVVIDWWLAIWTSSAGTEITVFGRTFPNQYDGIQAQTPYLIVYVVLIVFMFVFLVARTQWAIHGGIRASRRVFSNMTHRVLHAPMSYFDTTPLGRIINRFTYDVEQVDIALAQNMSILIICCSWAVAAQVVMISIVPYMALVNAMVFSLYFVMLRYYRGAGADLQRLDAVSRSPIAASLSESIDGAATIKAFDKNRHFALLFQNHINQNSSAMLNFVAGRRWLAVRLDILGAFVTLCASLCITVFSDQLGLSPGLAGFFFIWGSTVSITFAFFTNSFSEAEAAITSIERMHSMEMLPQERSMITSKDNKVDSTWPQKGDLVFENVSLRYRPNLPLSLDKLSFSITHGQRCAVVGRTGAGKSTLTTALFRLVEIEEGTISLDGVDLSTLGLSDVRGRRNGMFILPQEPAVFAGSIRTNLDPFDSLSDEEIMRALQLVKFPGCGRGMSLLAQSVEEGGANFSAGEKQLLCLTRAMLVNPRLLVLDEATSSVDGATDDFVQRMLRSQFPNTTLLTIAHRLNTIIDYDVVIVMDKGKVAEIGSPKELLSLNGLFAGMVDATGPDLAAQLNLLAK